jgi:hypothetical protein
MYRGGWINYHYIMDGILTTRWLIRAEMLSHQMRIVLEKCDHLKVLKSSFENLQSDCNTLFAKMTSEELIYYLEWFATSIFHALADIDHLETGRIFDRQRLQTVQLQGWLHKEKNTHFFAPNSEVDDENTIKLSIMSMDGHNHAVLKSLIDLHADCDLHDAPELCASIQSKILAHEICMRDARKELRETMSFVQAIMRHCSFWNVLVSVHPLESVTCHVNIAKGLLTKRVLNRDHLDANFYRTREYIRSHLLRGRIPDRLNGSRLTERTLLQANKEEERSILTSWEIVQAEFACKEVLLADQRARFDKSYQQVDQNEF